MRMQVPCAELTMLQEDKQQFIREALLEAVYSLQQAERLPPGPERQGHYQQLPRIRVAAIESYLNELEPEAKEAVRLLLSDRSRWAISGKGGYPAIRRGTGDGLYSKGTQVGGRDAIAVAVNLINECIQNDIRWQDHAPVRNIAQSLRKQARRLEQKQRERRDAATATDRAEMEAAEQPPPPPADQDQQHANHQNDAPPEQEQDQTDADSEQQQQQQQQQLPEAEADDEQQLQREAEAEVDEEQEQVAEQYQQHEEEAEQNDQAEQSEQGDTDGSAGDDEDDNDDEDDSDDEQNALSARKRKRRMSKTGEKKTPPRTRRNKAVVRKTKQGKHLSNAGKKRVESV